MKKLSRNILKSTKIAKKTLILCAVLCGPINAITQESNSGPVYNFNFFNNSNGNQETPKIEIGKDGEKAQIKVKDVSGLEQEQQQSGLKTTLLEEPPRKPKKREQVDSQIPAIQRDLTLPRRATDNKDWGAEAFIRYSNASVDETGKNNFAFLNLQVLDQQQEVGVGLRFKAIKFNLGYAFNQYRVRVGDYSEKGTMRGLVYGLELDERINPRSFGIILGVSKGSLNGDIENLDVGSPEISNEYTQSYVGLKYRWNKLVASVHYGMASHKVEASYFEEYFSLDQNIRLTENYRFRSLFGGMKVSFLF